MYGATLMFEESIATEAPSTIAIGLPIQRSIIFPVAVVIVSFFSVPSQESSVPSSWVTYLITRNIRPKLISGGVSIGPF